jgi:hypothetical protein
MIALYHGSMVAEMQSIVVLRGLRPSTNPQPRLPTYLKV